MTDLIAQPCGSMVTAFEGTDGGVFMCFECNLECKVIGLTTRVGEEDLISLGKVSLKSFNIVGEVFVEISGVDVDGRVGLLYSLENGRIRVPDMCDIIIEVEEGSGVVGGVVVGERGFLNFEGLFE